MATTGTCYRAWEHWDKQWLSEKHKHRVSPSGVRHLQSLAHFANLLQVPWAEMFAGRHWWHQDCLPNTTHVLHHALFRNCTAGVRSVPLCPSHLCLWRPSRRAAPRSRGCWARACPAWQPCAPMTCSSPGQCLSEQTSASSSSEMTSCCCSEPPYEASLPQKHKHVVTCISCSPGQEVISLSFWICCIIKEKNIKKIQYFNRKKLQPALLKLSKR